MPRKAQSNPKVLLRHATTLRFLVIYCSVPCILVLCCYRLAQSVCDVSHAVLCLPRLCLPICLPSMLARLVCKERTLTLFRVLTSLSARKLASGSSLHLVDSRLLEQLVAGFRGRYRVNEGEVIHGERIEQVLRCKRAAVDVTLDIICHMAKSSRKTYRIQLSTEISDELLDHLRIVRL